MEMKSQSGERDDSREHMALVLSRLRQGMPGITPVYGGSLAQAAAVCLQSQGHASGVSMQIDGDYRYVFEIRWDEATEQAQRCGNDLQDATEHGAYGIAAMLVEKLTDYTVSRRSRKGTGFDYWLAPKDSEKLLFQDQARLEVSGILCGSEAEVERRLRKKKIQIDRFESRLPGFVVIIEFGRLQGRMANI